MTISWGHILSNHQKQRAMYMDNKNGWLLLGSYLLNRYEGVATYSDLSSTWYASSIILYQLYKHKSRNKSGVVAFLLSLFKWFYPMEFFFITFSYYQRGREQSHLSILICPWHRYWTELKCLTLTPSAFPLLKNYQANNTKTSKQTKRKTFFIL